MDLWFSWGSSKACTQLSGDSGYPIGMEKVESAVSVRKRISIQAQMAGRTMWRGSISVGFKGRPFGREIKGHFLMENLSNDIKDAEIRIVSSG